MTATDTLAVAGSTATSRSVNPYWLLVLPLLAVLVLLYVVPIFQVLWVSVTDPAPGLQNYERLITSAPTRRVLLNTFRLCAITAALSMLCGYVIAYAMTHVGGTQRSWMLLFVLVPFWMSVLVRAFAWLMLLHDGGLVNTALLDAGLTSEPLPLVRNEFGVILGMTHYMIPYAVLPLLAGMRGIDPRLVMAARSLGATPATAFLRIFLPLSLPGIVGAGILVFILTLGFFVTPAILGGGKTVMIAEYISVQILQTARWGVGAMMAVVLLAITFLLLGLTARFVNLREIFGAR